MNRRLFWKIWLGFWATYLVLAWGLWLFWSLRPPKLYAEWDAPHAVGSVLVESAAKALREGGPQSLARQIASWPSAPREHLTVATLAADSCAPGPDPRMIARRVGEDYCLRYATPPLPSDDAWTGPVMPPVNIIGTTLAGLAFSAILAWYLTSPIRRLRWGLDRLARGELEVRLGPSMGRRRDEVADLARHFDSMAERLQELIGVRDRLLHDVSHELRSPLARLRLATSLLRRDPGRLDSLDRIDREADHLDARIGELLTLAKLESGAHADEEYFDLLGVLRLVLEDVGFEASSLNVTVNANLSADAPEGDWLILGSGLLVHRAVENILRNALRFSAAGGSIDVVLQKTGLQETGSQKTDKGYCVITIDDQGPGIAENTKADLLKPFVQGPAQEGAGFGLGLAIAQRAIATCGGSVELANLPSKGLRVTVSLPLSREIDSR